jgi:hypothetical protein
MKKTALLAAAAALMVATPAAAQGYLGLEYGSGNIDFGGGSDTDLDLWQGEGAFGFGGGSWGGQIDGQVGNLEADSGGEADFWTLGGHAWWNGAGWRLGGVITTTQLSESGTDIDEIQYGLEGTYDIGANAVLRSSLTTGTVDTGGSSEADLFNWDIGANFYSSPNVRFGGFFGIGNLDAGGGLDVDTTSYGLNAEFQPWTAPVSITLGWNQFDIDDVDVSSSVFSVGARWNFGGGTVRDRDNAAPFDTNTGYINRLYDVW